MSVNNDLNFDLFIPQVAYIKLQELWNIAYKLYKTNFMIYLWSLFVLFGAWQPAVIRKGNFI